MGHLLTPTTLNLLGFSLRNISLHFYQVAVAIKISNLLTCFCSFDLSCPILEKEIVIENLYIVFRAVLTHGPNKHLSGGANKHRGHASIGGHANLCMLGTLKYCLARGPIVL